MTRLTTFAHVAKNARQSKERHPEYYCAEPRCLWRTYNARTGTYNPCPKHERRK